MGGASWRKEEKVLCLQSATKQEFTEKYIRQLGQPAKLSRIDNIWAARKEIKAELVPVNPPGTVTTPRKEGHHDVDEAEILVNISNKLSELIQIQKDTFTLFKRLDAAKETTDDKTSGTGNG
jgi:hypothetical protein